MRHDRYAGNLLRLARALGGLSQRQLATMAGVAQPQIAAYESGARQPTLPTLLRIIEAAGYELRARLEPPDDQARLEAAWFSTQPPEFQEDWQREQDRIVAGHGTQR